MNPAPAACTLSASGHPSPRAPWRRHEQLERHRRPHQRTARWLTPQSRRSLLAAAAAAVGAVAAEGVLRPAPVEAASVTLGDVNSTTKSTTIRNTKAASGAKALVGEVTTTVVGPMTAGVVGRSSAQNGRGTLGVANSGSDARGVMGSTVSGVGVYGEATASNGTGMKAVGGTAGYGLVATGAVAINATSVPAPGLIGVAGTGFYAVIGYGQPFGVIGHGSDKAVQGIGSGAAATGVYGEGATYACDFSGNGRVTGDLEVGGNVTSVVDHPADPANRLLAHAAVAAPEVLTMYRGTVRLDARGNATVRLPAYLPVLNTDFGYQLTPIGAAAPDLHVAREIEGSTFRDRWRVARPEGVLGRHCGSE